MSSLFKLADAFGDLFGKHRQLTDKLSALDPNFTISYNGYLYDVERYKVGQLECIDHLGEDQWVVQVKQNGKWVTVTTVLDFTFGLSVLWLYRHEIK